MRATLIFIILTASLAAQPQQESPRTHIFVASIGTGEIATETVTISKTGWSSKGSFDLFGTRGGDYTAELERTTTGFTFKYTIDTGGKTIDCDAKARDGALSIGRSDRDTRREIEIAKGRVFVFENLLWASFVELGALLAEADDAGKLKDGVELPSVSAMGGAKFEVAHQGSDLEQQMVAGTMMTVRVSKLRLPPNVDMTVVSSLKGLPLRIDIPAQKLSVVAKGFEEIRGRKKAPTSIVDAGPWRAKLSSPDREVVVEKGVMTPMRDGVRLAADIYRPKGGGPFPTVLARTPYNRQTEGGLKGKWYARRGYVFVSQDVRGRSGSEGKWFPFTSEEHDGSDTIDWIAAQPWSDKKVGMVGASYVGLVQWLAAKSKNPHLKCIVPQVSPPDPFENFPYEGGAFLFGAAWWARVLEAMKNDTDWAEGLDWLDALAKLPLKDLDKSMKLKEPSFLSTWVSHPPHDTEFWDHATYQNRFHEMTVPAFHISGWYDGDMPGAIMNFPAMKAKAATEEARNGQYLVMGPWTHMFNSSRKIGHVDFGAEGVVDLDSRILRFFDRYLKGIDNGIEKEPHAHLFTMGSNKWHGESDWPVPGTRFTRLHLASKGNARKRNGDGRLQLATATGPARDHYLYDPTDLPKIDVDFSDLSGAQATEDMSKKDDRDDDLNYLSPPLATPCEILGPVSIVLWVSTDAKDTDFAGSFYRITRDGKRYHIRGGLQRLRYASHPTRDRPVTPGTIAKVTIDCWATGIQLEAGDRIELELTSWAWPGFGRNHNTLEPHASAIKSVVATNVIYHSAKHPSHLLLPVVPRKEAPGLTFEDK